MLTTRETAERLGVTVHRVRQMIAEGRLKAEKKGRDLWVPEASLEAEIRRRSGEGSV